MDLSHITVNTQNSIRIEGSKILYYDPFQGKDCRHDADLVFITHEHYDHFDPDSIANVKEDSTLLIAPESMKKKALSQSGIGAGKCLFYKTVTIRYYVTGDTDVNEDIRKVQCDVALIPIGGFYTLDQKQAAEYIAELKPAAVIPTHYGTHNVHVFLSP